MFFRLLGAEGKRDLPEGLVGWFPADRRAIAVEHNHAPRRSCRCRCLRRRRWCTGTTPATVRYGPDCTDIPAHRPNVGHPGQPAAWVEGTEPLGRSTNASTSIRGWPAVAWLTRRNV